ncbi:helix-turn-helix domain-containing protein [Nocardia sp. NPDC127526]|uniref:helix-turn-helix domain-containing protein n=1 Tax=Nocardia sp. NPDC127526 TaxID=3345393 RepID=UPI003644A3E9
MAKTAYNVEEAAAEFGLKPRRIYDAMKAFELAYLEVGRNKIIRHTEMERWLDSHQPGKPKSAA